VFAAGNVRAGRRAERICPDLFPRGPFYTRRYGRVWRDGVRAVRARMPALGAAVLMLFTIYVLFVTRINDNAGFGCIVTIFIRLFYAFFSNNVILFT